MSAAPTIRSSPSVAAGALRYAAVAAILVVGGVHLQQYKSFASEVPTIGTLFILNAIGAAGIALGITALRGKLAALASVAGVALSLGAVISVLISLNGTIFGYSEPDLRPAITIALIAELSSIVLLGTLAIRDAGSDET